MFFGILIKMYYEEHNLAHFHSEYQGFKEIFLTETAEMIEGKGFPLKARRIVQEWCLEETNEKYTIRHST